MRETIKIQGHVIIKDNRGKILIDQKNVITNDFKKIIMKMLLYKMSELSSDKITIDSTIKPIKKDIEILPFYAIKFGRGGVQIPNVKDTNLYDPYENNSEGDFADQINVTIEDNLKIKVIERNGEIDVVILANIINKSVNKSFKINELGLFNNEDVMLTHLVFDAIYIEPSESQTLTYTITLL